MHMENIIKEIQLQFNEVIRYSQNYDELNTDALFDKWYKAKKEFIDAFGGKLIYEVPTPVEFTIDERQKDFNFNKFYNFANEYGNYRLLEFLMEEKENFYDNIVRKTHDNIPKGMKISRAFKFFIEDKEILDKLQTEMSQIIQETKMVGTLCFSVHPLDFLSSSENTYNWRSCHALNGEYRAGNLSYMVDSSTIICYLRGDEEQKLPRFPQSVHWNSKKWRMLLFISDNRNAIFAGRQYPFFNREILDIIRNEIINNILGESNFRYGFWSHFSNAVLKEFNGEALDPHICLDRKMYSIFDIVKDPKNALHFNDLLYSSVYTPYYCYLHEFNSEDFTTSIGGIVPCLRCGKEHVWLSDSMLCKDCEIKYGHSSNEDIFAFCSVCGSRHILDDINYVDGNYYCDDCLANEDTIICENCGRQCLSYNAVYDEKEGQWFCQDCYGWR